MRKTMNPVATDNGRFKDGNPATGEYGTVVTAEHMNNVQDSVISMQNEIITVLNEAGIAVNADDNTQLWQALQMIAGQVESIANLRQFEPVRDRQIAFVKGYYSGSHKGGGYFIADFADSTTADNAGTVIVTAGGKRWKRIYTELTPFDFGASLNSDATNAFRAAAGFVINLAHHTFITGFIPAQVKDGELRLLDNATAESPALNLENVNITAKAKPTSKTFTGARLLISSEANTATLTLPVGGFTTDSTILITTDNFKATELSDSSQTYAHILAKGLWEVTTATTSQTVLSRRLKAKREVSLNIQHNIDGTAKQLNAKVNLGGNAKVQGSNFTINDCELINQVTFESVTATLNTHHTDAVLFTNANVQGELHVINSLSHGIATYNSTLRIPKSSVSCATTNGIMVTQASNVMAEYAAVFDSGNSGLYAHTSSTIEARYSSSCFNGKKGSSGSVGAGFESESGSTLFAEGAVAISNDSYGFYANATSKGVFANTFSYLNYHNYYCLTADMYARGAISLAPRYRGFYGFQGSTINAMDSTASGAKDYDYCVQAESTILANGYKNTESTTSTPLNLNGLNKIITSNVFELNNYQSFNKGGSLNIEDNAITVTNDLHVVATGGTVSTINGRATEGALLQLRNLNNKNPVVLNNTGNIVLKGGEVKLSSYIDRVLLTYDLAAKKWVELSRAEHKDEYATYIKGSNLKINVSGEVTVDTDYHIIDGADYAQLTTINGRNNDGALLHIRGLSLANPVTVTSAGNIHLRNGDCVLSGVGDRLSLIYDSSLNKWVEASRNNEVTHSLAMPGWRKDGEFIMQWGTAEMSENSSSVYVDFPIAFNRFLFAIPIDVTNAARISALAIKNPDNTGMTIIGSSYAGTVRYVAYGQ